MSRSATADVVRGSRGRREREHETSESASAAGRERPESSSAMSCGEDNQSLLTAPSSSLSIYASHSHIPFTTRADQFGAYLCIDHIPISIHNKNLSVQRISMHQSHSHFHTQLELISSVHIYATITCPFPYTTRTDQFSAYYASITFPFPYATRTDQFSAYLCINHMPIFHTQQELISSVHIYASITFPFPYTTRTDQFGAYLCINRTPISIHNKN
jgi:hypothetical protein